MSADTRLRYACAPDGLAHRRLDDALALLADGGCAGVALPLDLHQLDAWGDDALARAERLRARCDQLCLEVVIQAGPYSRLDPRDGTEPALGSADPAARARRLAHLRRACDVAGVLRAEAVTVQAGAPDPGADREQAWGWAVDGLRALVDSHGAEAYALAVGPGPGTLVEDADDWARLAGQVPGLALALDTGHGPVSGRGSPQDAVRAFAPHLGAVAVGGTRRGVHEHLPRHEGDVDLPAVLQALVDVVYDRLVTVELSGDGSSAHEVVPRALAALRAAGG